MSSRPTILSSALPSRIGEYRILGVLGEGAMGRVFLAEQETPRRKVALKILRAAAGPDFELRLRREAELLAGLEHPGIARVYAAGTSHDGATATPYVAIEYVDGCHLHEHVRRKQLSQDQSLQLLVSICRAVHYAHTRGIVHRDLKPENIMVDGQGHARVLDFGIAHAMHDEVTRMTAAGQVLGTLPYMSPEQLRTGGRTVDPTTDVYALGVIAYELISGQLPYPGIVGATLLTAMQLLGSGRPARLARVVPAARGDLDTIVMKAIDADPARRYGSAAELASDLERYLKRRPIEARPPTATYVLRLFVHRHRILAAAAVLVAAVLVGATAVSVGFAVDAQRSLSEREAVNQFLSRMLTAADPEHALGEQLTVLDVLDLARGELRADSELPPEVEAQLQRTLGNTYVGLGRSAQGLELLQAASETVAAYSGPRSLDYRRLQIDVAKAMGLAGQEAQASTLLDEVLESLDQVGGKHRQLRIQAQIAQGDLLILRGYFDQAEEILRTASETSAATNGTDTDDTLEADALLALALSYQGRYRDSVQLARQVAERLTQRLGRDHPRSVAAWDIVALNLREYTDYSAAEAIYRTNLEAQQHVLGHSHAQTLSTQASLAAVLAMEGRGVEGAALARSAHSALVETLGPDAELTRNVASLRAYAVTEIGATEEAITLYQGLIAQARSNPDGPTANDLVDFNNLAHALMTTGKLEKAAELFAELMTLAARLLGSEHVQRGEFAMNYAVCLRRLGQLQQARSLLEYAYAVLDRELGQTHPGTQAVVDNLRQTYIELGHEELTASLPAASSEPP